MLAFVLYCLLATYALWVFYLAVMGLKRARDAGQLSKTATIFGYPVFIIGYALDIAVNFFVMSAVFLELPKEFTVTARLKRHKSFAGWRQKIALWFEPLLDPFDPSGNHI